MNHVLDLGEELVKSWRVLKEHLAFCLGVGVIFFGG